MSEERAGVRGDGGVCGYYLGEDELDQRHRSGGGQRRGFESGIGKMEGT